MYVPRSRISLAVWPHGPADWLPSLYLAAGMTEKQQMYVPRSRISLAVWPQGSVDWLLSVILAICLTEEQQMYVPSNRISLAVWPQGSVDWLPSVILAVCRTKRGYQLLAVWELSCVSNIPSAWHDPLPLQLGVSSLTLAVLPLHWRNLEQNVV